MDNNELINEFLQECFEDGISAQKVPFELKGFLKSMAAQQDSGELYRQSQNDSWIEETIKKSGIKFR